MGTFITNYHHNNNYHNYNNNISNCKRHVLRKQTWTIGVQQLQGAEQVNERRRSKDKWPPHDNNTIISYLQVNLSCNLQVMIL